MSRRGRLCWQSVVAVLSLLVGAAASPPAAAQDYKVIEPRVNDAQAKVLGGQVATILRDAAAPSAAANKQLDDFFKGYLYSSMTSVDPVQLGLLAEKREQLFQRYINAAKSPAARDYLNTITLQAMGAIAKGPYHPAVRYNAALIIGQLDAQAGAKALPAATEALVTLLENDEFNKTPVPTAVKVAALVSLQRHVRLGVEAPVGERITKAALSAANREELPEDASAKAYGWVRRQAAKLLAVQFEKGLTPPVFETLVRLVADQKIDLDDRCAIAGLLLPSMFAEAKQLEVESMALAVGELARNVLDVEAKEAGDFVDQMIEGGMPAGGGLEGGRGGFGMEGRGGFGMEGRGGFGMEGGGMDFSSLGLDDQAPKYEKRRMIDRTLAIVAAAEALKAGSPDELKERLTEFSAVILAVAEAAAPDNADLEAITPDVVQLAKDVNRLVGSWAPAKPVDEEEAPAPADDALELPEEAPPEAAAAPADAAGG